MFTVQYVLFIEKSMSAQNTNLVKIKNVHFPCFACLIRALLLLVCVELNQLSRQTL